MPARETTTRRARGMKPASRGRKTRAASSVRRVRPWKTGFGGSLWDTSILNKRITLDHLRRLNPRLFRWARFCCTSRWMSSFDNVPGFRRRPTFAVALTDFTSR